MYYIILFLKEKLIIFLLINFFITGIYAQVSNADKTIPDDKLKWEYFTGSPDSTSNYWATTYWEVYYKYQITSFHYDTVKVNVQVSHVLKATSWVLPDRKTDELLQHEQGHFNMAILCEEEFKKAMDSTVLFMQNYKQTIDSVFNSVLNNISKLSIEYDKETNHMLNITEQKRWNNKIEEDD